MNDGDVKTETFKVQVEIEGGKIVEKDITITIKGTNDAPTFTDTVTGLEGDVKQDAFVDPDGSDGGVPGVVFTGTLSGATDVDDPDGQLRFMLVGKDGKPVTELKTEYGTIVLTYETAADGSIITHYKYTLDNESTKLDEALNKLQNGETLPDGAKVVVVDPHGKVSEEQKDLTINIHKPDNEGGWDGGAGLIIDADKSEFNGAVVEDGRDLPQTPDVTEGLIFEGQLHAKWDGEGHTGTPPDRVFGIEEKDEFGHGTGKQIQSSAADGFVTAEGKYGYLVVDPVTGKYTYTLYSVQDVLARNHFGAVVGAVDGDGNLLLNHLAVCVTHVDDERIGQRLALSEMVGQLCPVGRVGVGAVAVLIEGQRDSAVLGRQRVGSALEVVLERRGFGSLREGLPVSSQKLVDVMRLQGF